MGDYREPGNITLEQYLRHFQQRGILHCQDGPLWEEYVDGETRSGEYYADKVVRYIPCKVCEAWVKQKPQHGYL